MDKSLILLECPFAMGVSGVTSSGKTFWVERLLQNVDNMLNKPVNKILYCYGAYQDIYNEMERDIKNIEFHQGIPNDISHLYTDNSHTNILVLDDLMTSVLKSPYMEDLFTKFSHHGNVSIIFIVQNLYAKSPLSRSIFLNTSYFVLFKNPRGHDQIKKLNQQIFPCKKNFLFDAYTDAVINRKFGYLMVDLHPRSDPAYQVRTEIFPTEFPIIYKFVA